MRITIRLLVEFVPFVFTIVFGWAVAGPLSLGGGEKDIFLVIPLLIWSFVYLVSYFVLWWRRFGMARSVGISAAIATGFVVVAWIVLAIVILVGSRN